MDVTVTPHTDVTTLLHRPAQYGAMVGEFTDLKHVLNPWTGLAPGLFGGFREEPRAGRPGGNTAVHVPYGDVVHF